MIRSQLRGEPGPGGIRHEPQVVSGRLRQGRAPARSGRARFEAFFRVLLSGFGASGELVFTFLRRTYPDRAGARPRSPPETTPAIPAFYFPCWISSTS